MSTGDRTVNSPEIRRLAPVIEPGHSYASVTDQIASIVLTRPIVRVGDVGRLCARGTAVFWKAGAAAGPDGLTRATKR